MQSTIMPGQPRSRASVRRARHVPCPILAFELNRIADEKSLLFYPPISRVRRAIAGTIRSDPIRDRHLNGNSVHSSG